MPDTTPSLHPIEASHLHARRERVFLVLAGLFLGSLTMLNILGVTRFIVLASWGTVDGRQVWQWGRPLFEDPYAWTFALAAGVLPYPITFLCTDFISEFYGRRRANFVVFVGFLLNLWVIFILWATTSLPGFVENDPVTGMPPLPVWSDEAGAYRETGWTLFQVRNLAFGAVIASMIAYFAAQFCDVYLFHFWKKLTNGKHLWLRNNGSTLVSQMVDTVAVILITHFLAHALPLPPEGRSLTLHLMLFIVTGYAFKFVCALVDTIPFYIGVRYLSRYLRIDPTIEHRADVEAVSLDDSSDGDPAPSIGARR